MVDITNIKKTFAINPRNNNFQVSIQYNNETYHSSFETEDECISYI